MAKDGMKTCKYCKEQINKKAKRCPHCGGKQKGILSLLVKIVVIIILFFIVLGVFAELSTDEEDFTDSTDSSSLVQTKRTGIDKQIYDNDFFTVTINSIELHEIDFTVTNKTDVDFTIMVSDLYLDDERYLESESCWEIRSGESEEMIYYNEKETLNIDAKSIAGTFKFIDDGGLYGDVQKELEFEKVSIE
jgi:hypothetical protein